MTSRLLILLAAASVSLAHSQSSPPLADLPVYAGWAFANKGEVAPPDAEKVQLILDHGYAGFMGCKVDDPAAVKQFGAVLPGNYFRVTPETETFDEVEERLQAQLPFLSKEEGAFWLFSTRSAETALDETKAIEMLRQISDWSNTSGYRVDLYSHRESEKTKFHWPHSAKANEYIEKAGVDNLGIVLTVYHERFNGFEDEVIERFDRFRSRIRTVALFGPEMIARQESGDPFYQNLMDHLAAAKYDGTFLIYSRPYQIHASEYLPKQKAAFEAFRDEAAGK